MSVVRIFIPSELAPGMKITIPEEEAKHLKVRRVTPRSRITILNGKGKEATATLINKKEAVIENVNQPPDRELPVKITLYIGVLKGEKMDMVIQKSVELGVFRIVPVIFKRCVVQPKKSKLERWKKIAIEALKQSGRVLLPEITHFEQVNNLELIQPTIMLWEKALYPFDPPAPIPQLGLIIGPEGGIDEEEARILINKGAQPASAGQSILRAETAALFALSVARYKALLAQNQQG